MLRTAMLAIALFATSAAADAAPCRDAKGKFIKCAPAAATKTTSGVTKGKDGKCRDAKGHFAKCPS